MQDTTNYQMLLTERMSESSAWITIVLVSLGVYAGFATIAAILSFIAERKGKVPTLDLALVSTAHAVIATMFLVTFSSLLLLDHGQAVEPLVAEIAASSGISRTEAERIVVHGVENARTTWTFPWSFFLTAVALQASILVGLSLARKETRKNRGIDKTGVMVSWSAACASVLFVFTLIDSPATPITDAFAAFQVGLERVETPWIGSVTG